MGPFRGPFSADTIDGPGALFYRRRGLGICSQAKAARAKTLSADESVFFSSFPEVEERFLDSELEERWKKLLSLRDEVNKALEIKRAEKFIGNSLEAKVRIFLPEEYRPLAESYLDFLPMFFLVSSLELTRESCLRALMKALISRDFRCLLRGRRGANASGAGTGARASAALRNPRTSATDAIMSFTRSRCFKQ